MTLLVRMAIPYDDKALKVDLVVHGVAIVSGLTFPGAYATTFVMMFSVSAAYNAWPRTAIKRLLWRLDHCSIVCFALTACALFRWVPLPLLCGSLIYLGGAVFLLWTSLRFHNAIWHGFVLAAAATHATAI